MDEKYLSIQSRFLKIKQMYAEDHATSMTIPEDTIADFTDVKIREGDILNFTKTYDYAQFYEGKLKQKYGKLKEKEAYDLNLKPQTLSDRIFGNYSSPLHPLI